MTNDFLILGPTFSRGNKVLEAIHALYYLPDHFKLVFTDNSAHDEKFNAEVLALIARDEVAHRVSFVSGPVDTHAVILPHPRKSRVRCSVAGDSPEALASALLNVARTIA